MVRGAHLDLVLPLPRSRLNDPICCTMAWLLCAVELQRAPTKHHQSTGLIPLVRGRWGKLAAKPEKVTAFTQGEAGEKTIAGFCDSQNRCLYVYEQEGAVMGSTHAPPNITKLKKTLVFSKEEDPEVDHFELAVGHPPPFPPPLVLVSPSCRSQCSVYRSCLCFQCSSTCLIGYTVRGTWPTARY